MWNDEIMNRTVSSHLLINAYDPADLIFSIAVAESVPVASETLTFVADGRHVEAEEIIGRHGTRLHRITGHQGRLAIDYEAEVVGFADPPPVDDLDIVTYRRPSRYAESDSLIGTARAEFSGLDGKQLLDAVSSWVGDKLRYVPGASQPTDGAIATMLSRRGVCRDYAHLVVALLRGLDIPARLTSVYAPGLSPMDFHAVAEAYIQDAWYVVDATAMAPRSSLVRIATGQDASETAFLSQHWSAVALNELWVTAVVDELPSDDVTQLVQLR